MSKVESYISDKRGHIAMNLIAFLFGRQAEVCGGAPTQLFASSRRLATRRNAITPIYQTESNECLLICFAMIMEYYNSDVSVSSLRAENPVFTRGARLADLADLCRKYKLTFRAVRTSPRGLGQLKLPCVVHWRFYHFVVLERLTESRATIVDPNLGRVVLTMSEFAGSFTGVAAELSPLPEFGLGSKAGETRFGALPAFLKQLRFAYASIVWITLVSFIAMAFSIIIPMIIKYTIDDTINYRSTVSLKALMGAFLLAISLSHVVEYARAYIVLRTAAVVRHELTHRFIAKLLYKRWSYFMRRGLGVFIAQFDSLAVASRLFVTNMASIIVDVVFFVGVFAAFAYIQPVIAVVILVSSLLVFILRTLALDAGRRLLNQRISTSADEQSYFVETVRGLASIKSNDLIEQRIRGFVSRVSGATRSMFVQTRFELMLATATGVIKSIELVLFVYIVVNAVLAGDLTIGAMYSLYAYKQLLDARLLSLIAATTEIVNISTHLLRLEDLNDSRTDSPRRVGGEESVLADGDLELHDICYAVDNHMRPLFSGVSLRIPRGSFCVVRGVTGSGKTTLLRIIMQFIAPDRGFVTYAGERLHEANSSAFTRRAGAVLQDDRLFSGTISENVSLFSEAPDPVRIQECCELVCIHDDIGKLPLGYNTYLQDGDVLFSTGQRQRLLLARALYKNCDVLLLDEATAHLDEAMAQVIYERLRRLDKTIVFASHSESILRHCTLCVTLSDGMLKETPPPQR